MSFARAIATVGGLTLVSRVAGFARDILTAALLGAGPVGDAFFVALKLPNLFRRLFAEGAFSVAFVPLFNAELEGSGRDSAIAFAERALGLMVAVLVPFTVAIVAAMPWAVTVIAPGFVDEPQRYDLAVAFSRITFPYLLLVALVALMGGVLNSLDRFAPFAAAPILFNLTLIAALLGLTPLVASPGHALSWGVAASGVVQLLFLAEACRRAGVRLRLVRPSLTPRVRRLFRLMGPAALGAGVLQINSFVDVLLASLLPAGAVSFLYYADRLYQLPLGVVGIAIGTALLPMLSRRVTAGDGDGAAEAQNRAIEYGLLLALPAAAALMAVPGPILAVLFERGRFGPEDTALTALALGIFAAGIPAYILIKVLSTVYFARQDTASPVKAATVAAGLNIALGVVAISVLDPRIGHAGLAGATAVSAWVNAAILARGLVRGAVLAPDRRLVARLPRLVVAAAAMAAGLIALAAVLEAPLAGPLWEKVPALAGLVGAGAAVYFGLAHLLGGTRLGDLRALLGRKPA